MAATHPYRQLSYNGIKPHHSPLLLISSNHNNHNNNHHHHQNIFGTLQSTFIKFLNRICIKLGINREHRRNIQLLILTVLIFCITFLLVLFTPNREKILDMLLSSPGTIINQFGSMYDKIEVNINSTEEATFNKNLNNLLQNKLEDEEKNTKPGKLWVLQNGIYNKMSEIPVPSYFYSKKETKPEVQPFDSRFTLAMYYNYINKVLLSKKTETSGISETRSETSETSEPSDRISVPSNWIDWKDLSSLYPYILALELDKLLCSDLDSHNDHDLIKGKEEAKVEKEKAWEKEKEKKKELEKEKEKKEKEKEKEKNENDQKGLQKRDLKHYGEVFDHERWCVPDSNLSPDHNDGHKLHPGFNVFRPPGRMTESKYRYAGQSYLYSFAPPPSQIVFLTDKGPISVDTDSNLGLLNNQLPEQYVADSSSSTKINLVKEFQTLKNNYNLDETKLISSYHHNIPEEHFKFNQTQALADLEKRIALGEKLNQREINYKESLEFSIDKIKNSHPGKYFYEAKLMGTNHGDHYDWRFFNKMLLMSREQAMTLHHLVRAWLSFTRQNGITTWIAHGSLLSWYWNGMNFPWDFDIDVQVPIRDLHLLSMNFNQSLIVEDPTEGTGRYFLDCGSYVGLREKNNGNNAIDARFIDVDTGMYVDITALAVSNTKAEEKYWKDNLPLHVKINENDWTELNTVMKLYNCRNNHFYSYDEISPLVKTVADGEIAYIPAKWENMLKREYRLGMTQPKFEKHVWLDKLRIWVPEEDVYYFLRNKTSWIEYYSKPALERNGVDSNGNPILPSYCLTEEEKAELRKFHNPFKDPAYLYALRDSHLEAIKNATLQDMEAFLLKDELLLTYISSRRFTWFHMDEMENKLLAGDVGESVLGLAKELVVESGTNLELEKHIRTGSMMFDPFLYNMVMRGESFELRIENVQRLMSLNQE
ncbi:hypothetical protein LELG_05710 [Lodderomyces elongisporus NRRL YB-4239]|uniref:LicD/FKTN/FKRP nucleotidyltransferase domain-containing protein n=1 Tax=Lodderomyces elongisporus (strain ATCC 11503 / CBS 2605 / JCM 1781 / NBRC 1676 / NRRL YB-4239) TaxID=379508 RepID=A5E7X1_LODEL|nr:hypothetical protein LELG_05710 [Lodderomyces elongisporus NRRL YB-4239]